MSVTVIQAGSFISNILQSMPEHREILHYLETSECWQQEVHPARENLLQSTPSDPYKHGRRVDVTSNDRNKKISYLLDINLIK